jgi:hypothetical protein
MENHYNPKNTWLHGEISTETLENKYSNARSKFLSYGLQIKQLFQSDVQKLWKTDTELVGTGTHVTE